MKSSNKHRKLLAAERLKAAGRLASEIAHELNTPLGGILMYSHLILDDMPRDDPCRENIIKINKLAHRCKIIVQGLLDFSKHERLNMRPVSINRILRSVIGFMEDHVLFKGVSIQTDFDTALPSIRADENKLEQLFINLILNAGESMDGNGTLTLCTAIKKNQVRIECSDTGEGIADEHIGRIFEPFFTTKNRGKGTGLGLSISHGIVELHGGTITVESRKGHGSAFTVLLPVEQEAFDCGSQNADF